MDIALKILGLEDAFYGAIAMIAVVGIIYNMALCLFGYKIFKFQLGAIGFLVGGFLGGFLGGIAGDSSGSVLFFGLACAIFGVWVSLKLYKIGVFITVASTSTLIMILLFGASGNFNPASVIISAILGIGAGVVGVILDKVIIIIYTAVSGGMLSGIFISIAMRSEAVFGFLIGIILSALGIWIQNRMEKEVPLAATTKSEKVENIDAQSGNNIQNSVKDATNFISDAISKSETIKNISTSSKEYINNISNKISKADNTHQDQVILVSDKNNYWIEGMPIVIREIEISREIDNEENIFLNLEIQNLSEYNVVGIYFDVHCYNLLKQELEFIENLSILDLSIEKNQRWFTTKSIKLSENTTRKCIPVVKNVVLENEEIWSNEENAQLFKYKFAKEELSQELLEEYYAQLAEKYAKNNPEMVYLYAPVENENYWVCSCGQINTSSDECANCSLNKKDLLDIFSVENLQKLYEKRMEEKAYFEEQQRKRAEEKLFLEEERRQRIAEQTEAVKQKSLEFAENAKNMGKNLFSQMKDNVASVKADIETGRELKKENETAEILNQTKELFCTECGYHIVSGDVFCENCGNKIEY